VGIELLGALFDDSVMQTVLVVVAVEVVVVVDQVVKYVLVVVLRSLWLNIQFVIDICTWKVVYDK
jgi:hypothetical protein